MISPLSRPYDSYGWKYFLPSRRTAATSLVDRPTVSGEKAPPAAPKNRKLKSNPFWVWAMPWHP